MVDTSLEGTSYSKLILLLETCITISYSFATFVTPSNVSLHLRIFRYAYQC